MVGHIVRLYVNLYFEGLNLTPMGHLFQWFRQHGYLYDGKYKDLNSWLKGDWEAGMLTWDANDLVTLANTWFTGDISLVRDEGNYEQALRSIKVKGLVMPSKTDLYFAVRRSHPVVRST